MEERCEGEGQASTLLGHLYSENQFLSQQLTETRGALLNERKTHVHQLRTINSAKTEILGDANKNLAAIRQRFGVGAYQPDRQRKTHIDELEAELLDCKAALEQALHNAQQQSDRVRQLETRNLALITEVAELRRRASSLEEGAREAEREYEARVAQAARERDEAVRRVAELQSTLRAEHDRNAELADRCVQTSSPKDKQDASATYQKALEGHIERMQNEIEALREANLKGEGVVSLSQRRSLLRELSRTQDERRDLAAERDSLREELQATKAQLRVTQLEKTVAVPQYLSTLRGHAFPT
eukprot:gnl/Trimastix_PCT/3605.p1 GENE.gnl/Trimastix_PCT/3605~~gnl/Trimastix_PCT/3605.p1  ORF type:complete len:300 (+),score=52.52 gnl/Trimastix_PCT/3605:44-943(+)